MSSLELLSFDAGVPENMPKSRRLSSSSENPLPPEVKLEPELESGYRLTVYRIIDLLCHPRETATRRTIKMPGRHTEEVYFGSVTTLSRWSGVSRGSLEHLDRKRENGGYSEITRESFVKLAALLNAMQPPLVDPEDPEKREIKFSDVEVESFDGKTVYAGWEQLRHLHELDAPPVALPAWLSPAPPSEPLDSKLVEILSLLPEDKRKEFLSYLTPKDKAQAKEIEITQAKTKPQVEPSEVVPEKTSLLNRLEKIRMTQEREKREIRRLIFLIQADIEARGATGGIPDYVEKICAEIEEKTLFKRKTSEDEKAEIVAGLETILFRETIPRAVPTLLSLSFALKNDRGEVFQSVPALLEYCGFPSGENEGESESEGDTSENNNHTYR